MAKRDNLHAFPQPRYMRQDRLLAVFLLLLLLLVAQRIVAGPVVVTAVQDKTVRPEDNGKYISLSVSKSGGGELDGGYGAVIEAEVAPANGVLW
uniref:Uncharacterized protein n=1 Tax=Thermofilum adornatum TaxID=1365176 RepID=A0A7C1CD54_9CREN